MGTITLNVKAKPIDVVINSVTLTGTVFTMDYTVNTEGLSTPEYEVATDEDFNDVVFHRAGFVYVNPELISTLKGTYTTLYFRARRHSTLGEVSDWSNTVLWTGTYEVEAPFVWSSVNIAPNDGSSPPGSICTTGNMFTRALSIDTEHPVAGTTLYLEDKKTVAIPGNIASLNGGGLDFNALGIRWIRFNTHASTTIWEVDPDTGVIEKASTTHSCGI